VEIGLLLGATSRGVWGRQRAGGCAVRADLLLLGPCNMKMGGHEFLPAPRASSALLTESFHSVSLSAF
jgi:hypothetical protein